MAYLFKNLINVGCSNAEHGKIKPALAPTSLGLYNILLVGF